jgi:uncharacterized protein with HEPN domain
MSKDNAHLRDILDSARLIRSYLKDLSFEAFQTDTVRQDAVARRFEIIGEATKRLSAEIRAQFPAIPWELAAGMRDVLIHDYDDVNLEIVWHTATESLPPLIQQLEAYLAQHPPVE